jgi:gluconolactonase
MWFSDYKFRTGATEDWDVDFEGVYHVSADLGTKTLVVGDLHRPHKVLLSIDERTLYVGQHDGILAFDRMAPVRGTPVEPGASDGGRVDLDSRRWFWRAGEHGSPEPDGIKLDTLGNVYVAGRRGVWFLSHDGDLLGHLDTCGLSTPNLCFGGTDGRTLFFVGNHAVFRVPVRIRGVPCRPPIS